MPHILDDEGKSEHIRRLATRLGVDPLAPLYRRALWWLVWHVPLGPLAPWVFGAAIGRWPHKTENAERKMSRAFGVAVLRSAFSVPTL